LVTTGFCPAICAQFVHRAIHQLGVLVASPKPMLTETFSIFGTAITFL
jgi:hypothetical protein